MESDRYFFVGALFRHEVEYWIVKAQTVASIQDRIKELEFRDEETIHVLNLRVGTS